MVETSQPHLRWVIKGDRHRLAGCAQGNGHH
jgi:hypothetical protein